ncbi:MAG: bifunctional 5,10-methylene-tetrahydrofolate dehydrogenase/5,10-methylene-tetrahydrofolate cyclohydrolase [Bacteroidia bacterium]|nr:bifunctional 5,10-methylene-tetrahydrofolate dehydrogenase/5,10-methylene-tetrahydrofolate cyclohydrolase [Bacteroidia bacterium]
MQIIDGKLIAEEIKNELATEVKRLKEQNLKIPYLVAIIVGNDPASETYVAGKVKACEQIGFRSTEIRLSEDTGEKLLLEKIIQLNEDEEVDGLIVQLPLPKHISPEKVIETIDYRKDVDGFHPVNTGRMMLNLPSYIAATPFGIIELLKRYHIETEGRRCAVLGRSNIVGTPVSILMSRKAYPGNATVTLCHSKTRNIKEITLQSDIIIAAIGSPGFLTGDMVKDGAVVIDVGIHRIADPTKKSGFRLTGDVKYDEVAPKCSYISPVPGGVGLMTVVSLLKNTLIASKKEIYG